MFSVFSDLGLAFSASAKNKQLVSKYSVLNSAAAKSIQNLEIAEIIEESRIISPKVSEIHKQISSALSSGRFSKMSLQSLVIEMLNNAGLYPSIAGYKGYPAVVPISVNEELIHNIPDRTKIAPGSLVTVEIGASTKKAYASQTWSFLTPPVNPEQSNLLAAAKLALNEAINLIEPGRKVGDIGFMIQNAVEEKGYNVVREYCGFSMGKERIMEPQLPCYGESNTGPSLKSGQILNVHVLAIDGKRTLKMLPDNWGLRASTGKNAVALSAMILITDSGHALLTDVNIN